jgi:hypothetical protein
MSEPVITHLPADRKVWRCKNCARLLRTKQLIEDKCPRCNAKCELAPCDTCKKLATKLVNYLGVTVASCEDCQ